MSLEKRGRIWHYSFHYKGERYRGTTECTNKWEAQAFENEQRRLVRERISSGHTLADVLRIWLNERKRSNNEIGAIRRLLRGYPSRSLADVRGDELRASVSGKESTKNRTISIVNSAFALARTRGIPTPPNIAKYSSTPHRLRFLTLEEWTRLEAELSGHVLHICQFAVYTGLRSANVLGLKWSNVNLETKTVWVDAADAKGRRAIAIPLSSRAFALLEKLQNTKNESGFVFTYKDKPIKSIKTAFNKAVQRAGLEDVTFHSLRRTWASWKVQKGVPLKVVQELGGWSSIEILVKHYAHLSPDHLRQWVD